MTGIMPVLGTDLISKLGPEIGNLAGNFLSARKAREPNETSTFHTGLAPSFGELKDDLRELDKELCLIIAVTTKKLAAMAPEERSWDNVIAALQQNPVLKPMEDTVHKTDTYCLKGFTLLGGNGKPDKIAMEKVGAWFRGFIGDADVLASTKIDIGWCEYTVCQTGAAIKNIVEVVAKSQKINQVLVDIGVLRYPTMESPYFKVFRIQLKVWAETNRILNFQTDNNGVTGDFSCRRYEACSTVIDRLTKKVIDKAVDEVTAMFS